MMEPMLAEFAALTASVSYQAPRIPLVSGLTGQSVTNEVMDPNYWVRHVREPVRFADAVTSLRLAGAATFVEVGPTAALTPMASPGAGEVWLPVMRRDRDESATLIAALAGVHVRGGVVDWAAFYAGDRKSVV